MVIADGKIRPFWTPQAFPGWFILLESHGAVFFSSSLFGPPLSEACVTSWHDGN